MECSIVWCSVLVVEIVTKTSRFAHFWQGAQSPARATQTDIWTANSGRNPCFFLHFWLGNVVRATTACTFWTSQLPKVVRTLGVLSILSREIVSRHNGVQILFSHLTTWLRTRRFSEPSFWPSGTTNHWKNKVNGDFPTFPPAWFFLLTLYLFWCSLFFSSPLWLFPPLLFHVSIWSEVWLVNFGYSRICLFVKKNRWTVDLS